MRYRSKTQQTEKSAKCGVRTFEKALLHKAIRTLGKMIRNNLFRTLQINQSLAAIYGMFSQGKQLNLSKNKGTWWHFYSLYSDPPLPSSAVALITGVCIQSGNSSLTATESGRMCLSSIKAPFPEKCHFFFLSGLSLEEPTLRLKRGLRPRSQ